MTQPFSLPIRELARREKVSPTKLYRLADEGEIETVAEGKRRRVFVDSWVQYLLRLKAEQEGGKTRLPSSNRKAPSNLAAEPVANGVRSSPPEASQDKPIEPPTPTSDIPRRSTAKPRRKTSA